MPLKINLIKNFLPCSRVQVYPFPANPFRHSHSKDPNLFIQFAFKSHKLDLISHSSISKKIKNGLFFKIIYLYK